MITQAIKQWLHKLFAWWPWQPSTKTEYLHTTGSLNQGAAQEMTARSTIDGVAPRRSTIEEWPERIVQPSPPLLEERAESTLPSLPPPPTEKVKEVRIGEASASSISPTDAINRVPRAERQLEFLRYLVKRGIVNEGFAEGTVPDQYKFDDNRQAGSNQS
jgi:hypothetical protein